MSGALGKLGALIPRLPSGGAFNASGSAGPRRLMIIAGGVAGVAALTVAVTLTGTSMPTPSHDAPTAPVDRLPGGLHSTPEQDAVDRLSIESQAKAAIQQGASYTPPMAPSRPLSAPPPREEEPTVEAAAVLPRAAPPVRRAYNPLPEPLRVSFPAPLPARAPAPPAEAIRPTLVAAQDQAAQQATQQAAQQAYNQQIRELFNQWGGRPPRTDIVMPPSDRDTGSNEDAPQRASSSAARTRDAAFPMPLPNSSNQARVLVPAGRGIYAHPILAVNSDASSPIVLQADSGPIAGDRMIGSFAKQNDRLIIHVNSVIHNGENLSVDGLVIAPDSMEVGVASGIDHHYLERFVLPAAAAFVAGLGQAIATTSNSVSVLSPFGGATTSTNLGIQQQLGIAAGTAAGQVASTLNQSAPKGTTVSLDANVAVGVMFLSNVTAHGQ